MATVKQRLEFHEDGYGHATVWLTFSDSYDGAPALDTAVEVDVFDLESSSEEMEVDTGVLAADALSFSIYEDAVETEDDQAAIDLVLSAQNPATKVFCALIVSPADAADVEVEEIAFRGLVQPAMSWDDKQWSGEEYSGDIAPLREWSCSALSYDAELLLEPTVGDLMDKWKEDDPAGFDEWVSIHVADRLGYYDHGGRTARFARLVSWWHLMDKLLSLAAPDGITLSYWFSYADLYAVPARYNAIRVGDKRLRYSYVSHLRGAPAAYHTFGYDGDRYRLNFGPGYLDGALYVSWRVIRPTEEEKENSWVDMSLTDVLYGVATELGMYPDFSYASNTEIRVQLLPRSDAVGSAVYIADATDSSGDASPLESKEAKTFGGAVWRNLAEGRQVYHFDGAGFVVWANTQYNGSGTRLPLTIGPATCLLDTGDDMGVDMQDVSKPTMIAHNCVFYDGDTPRADPRHNRTAITTAMYIRCPGQADGYAEAQTGYVGSVGVEGKTCYLPVAYLVANIDGKDEVFYTAGSLVNRTFNYDQAFFKTELAITVPYLFAFRLTPTGSGHWRNVRRGSLLTLDGKSYVVIGIERQWRALETRLRLHRYSKFAFSEPGVIDDATDETAEEIAEKILRSEVKLYPPGEHINRDDAVTLRSDGKVYRSRAVGDDYSKVKGLAIDSFDEEEDPKDMIRVTTKGRHTLSTPIAEPIATRLFVRTNPAGWNVNSVPLVRKTGEEDLFYEIALVENETSVVVTHWKQTIFS